MLVERKDYHEKDGSLGYIESVFNSDNILKITYFPKLERLYIAFSRGHTYSYGNISLEKYCEFEKAESQGKYFHQKINNNKAYPTRKEFTLYPNEVNELKQIVEEHKEQIEDNDE
jgi:hypothetical protein